MAKETQKQVEMAEQYANPQIGQCIIPHCRTLQPAKGRFYGMCYWHYCRVGYWAKKVGEDLSRSTNIFSEDYENELRKTVGKYCAWLRFRIVKIWSRND